jgi:transcriptional regulator with XRE-family HTH domain
MDFFSTNIKFLRSQTGLTQSEISDRLGFSRSVWSEYEHGASKPRFNELSKIVAFFDICYSELLDVDLRKLNLNDRIELRKMMKKLNPNLNLSLNLNDKKGGKKDKGHASNETVDPAVLERLKSMEEEIQKMRSNLGQ